MPELPELDWLPLIDARKLAWDTFSDTRRGLVDASLEAAFRRGDIVVQARCATRYNHGSHVEIDALVWAADVVRIDYVDNSFVAERDGTAHVFTDVRVDYRGLKAWSRSGATPDAISTRVGPKPGEPFAVETGQPSTSASAPSRREDRQKPPISNPTLLKHLETIKAKGGRIPAPDVLYPAVVSAFPGFHVTRSDVRTVAKEVWGEQPPGRRRKSAT